MMSLGDLLPATLKVAICISCATFLRQQISLDSARLHELFYIVHNQLLSNDCCCQQCIISPLLGTRILLLRSNGWALITCQKPGKKTYDLWRKLAHFVIITIGSSSPTSIGHALKAMATASGIQVREEIVESSLPTLSSLEAQMDGIRRTGIRIIFLALDDSNDISSVRWWFPFRCRSDPSEQNENSSNFTRSPFYYIYACIALSPPAISPLAWFVDRRHRYKSAFPSRLCLRRTMPASSARSMCGLAPRLASTLRRMSSIRASIQTGCGISSRGSLLLSTSLSYDSPPLPLPPPILPLRH